MWYVELYEAEEDGLYLGSVGPFPNTREMLRWKETHRRSQDATDCRYAYFHLYAPDEGMKL